MRRKLFLGILSLSLPLAPSGAIADDAALANFIHSITTVYVFSEECVDTLSPGPSEYMKLIAGYLKLFYSEGAAYWILPEVSQRIKDKEACIVAMQEKLEEYKVARHDYKYHYPDQPNPPVLLAYNWRSIPSNVSPSPSPAAPSEKASPWE